MQLIIKHFIFSNNLFLNYSLLQVLSFSASNARVRSDRRVSPAIQTKESAQHILQLKYFNAFCP